MRPQFKAALPSHISPEKFERVVLTAINNDPDLLAADKRSLFNACSRAAQDGLLPDKREGALVIYKDNTGRKIVQWLPMVFGLIKKIRQSGEVESIGARIVFQKELDDKRFSFVVQDGQEKLFHDPMLWGERGEKVLVYAYARFKSGYVEYAPLHRNDVLKRKAASRAQNGPWKTWEDEMWLKTAIRAIAKRLPLSADIMRTVERDDEPTEFERLKQQAVETAAAQLGAPVGSLPEPVEAEYVDEETGEIIDQRTVEAGAAVLADDAASEAENEDQAFTAAEQTTARLIENLGDTTMKLTDLEEFKTSAHDIISGQEIAEDQKSVLLGRFNAAFLERKKAFGKQGAKAGARA